MKISTLVLSACGICVFYICYADWLDDLFDRVFEVYLGTDCEEVAPFVSSVASGTDEFDSIVAQFSRPARGVPLGWYVAATVLASLTVLLLAARLPVLDGVRNLVKCVAEDCDRLGRGGETGNLIPAFRREKQRKGGGESVRVIWRGNGLLESSVNCHLRDGEKHGEENLQAKAAGVNDRGSGDDAEEVTPSSSNDSTLQQMREMRKVLESETEVGKGLGSEASGSEGFAGNRDDAPSGGKTPSPRAGEEDDSRRSRESADSDGEKEAGADPQLMQRIRLLESKLRMEEMKNRNWISRMSRAEEILQQLNKQVERIEQDQTVEALTKTLRVASTVTDWMPLTPPGKSLQFTLNNIYYPPYPLQQQASLSEIIRREVVFPNSHRSGGAISSQTSSLMPILPHRAPLLSKLLPK